MKTLKGIAIILLALPTLASATIGIILILLSTGLMYLSKLFMLPAEGIKALGRDLR